MRDCARSQFVARATRLYEHGPGALGDRSRLGCYLRHGSAWARALGVRQQSTQGGGAGHWEVAGYTVLRSAATAVALNPSGA